MSIIETLKKVNGRFFRGSISPKGFEMTHFINHQPAISVPKQPPNGWDNVKPIGNFDSIFNLKVTQNFAVLSEEQIDIMIEELQTIKSELSK